MATTEQDAVKTPAPQVAQLRARFAPETKQRLIEYLASFKSFEPTLALLYGDTDGLVAGGPSWSVTAYGPRTVKDMVEMYANFGSVVLYELDGIQVIIPQLARIAELEGGLLEFTGNRIRRIQTANG